VSFLWAVSRRSLREINDEGIKGACWLKKKKRISEGKREKRNVIMPMELPVFAHFPFVWRAFASASGVSAARAFSWRF